MIISDQLLHDLPKQIVELLIETYTEIKRNTRVGGHRLAAVEGGRFCEASYRALEHMTSGAFTPLGQSIDTLALERKLAQLRVGSCADSIRLHIPRSLRVIYDIRNKRDAAHLADGIDPSLQDASLIVACASWVMAELIRLNHAVAPNEAADVVDRLVSRDMPAIQYFNGEPRVLGSLNAGDTCLLLLYARRGESASIDELRSEVRPQMRKNLIRTLQRLNDHDYVHINERLVWITYPGEMYIESRGLAGEV